MAELTEKERERLKKVKAFNQYRELFINKLERIKNSDFKEAWFPDIHIPQNINGRNYENINSVILSLQCERNSYQTGVFLTQKQIKDDNLIIKKGEKATYISNKSLKVTDDNGNEFSSKEYFSLPKEDKVKYKIETDYRYYPVFNIEQTNFPEKHKEAWETFVEKYSIEKEAQGNDYINPSLDKIIRDNNWICDIEISDNNQLYSWIEDKISLHPMQPEQIKDWYITALHGMSQSITHQSRLNKRFDNIGDERYIQNELVASLSSAYVARTMNMVTEVNKDSRNYCSNWISELKDNPSFIYSLIYDLKSHNQYMHHCIYSRLEKSNTLLNGEPPTAIGFEIEVGSSIVYAKGITETGEIFNSPVYHRGNEYCYTTGSIIKGDLQTFYLNPQQIATVEELRHYGKENSNTKIVIQSSRKTLTFDNNTATIKYLNKEYNANGIITTLKKHNINPKDITGTTWKNLLMGQGVQIDKSQKAIFSIIKIPKGYDMRVAAVLKKVKSKNKENINV